MAMRSSGKIGFITCASYRVHRPTVLDVRSKACALLSRLSRELDVQLVAPDVVPASGAELDRVLDAIARAEPDALILHLAGWTEDETTLKIVDAVGCPALLWVTGDVVADGVSRLIAHVGYMEASAFLRKMGRPVPRLYGGPDEESFRHLRAFALAAGGVSDLRRLNFGWIGQGCGSEGMLDGAFDENEFAKKTGVHFLHLALAELFERYRSVPLAGDPARNERLRALGVSMDALADLRRTDPRAVDDSLRLLLALWDFVAERNLGALSLRCFPEFRENDVPSPCLAIAILNQRGVPASCEGDVLSGVSMCLLASLSRRPATIMDVFARDDRLNTLRLFHCGSAAPALAGPDAPVQYRTHCKPANHRAGVTVEFPLPPGRVSFLKFDMIGPRCALFLYQGDALPPPAELRGTHAVVRTDTPVNALVESLLDHGVSHHQVLSPGDVSLAADYCARLLNMDLVCL
ncbi:MAG: hypothetical protein V2A58_13680 [Planctomycetota bacterium]